MSWVILTDDTAINLQAIEGVQPLADGRMRFMPPGDGSAWIGTPDRTLSDEDFLEFLSLAIRRRRAAASQAATDGSHTGRG